MRKTTINNSGPWLPWLAPSAIGVFDGANLIGAIATPLYVALIVAAATVTILTQGPRTVRDMLADRWERAAGQAQVREAALLAYRMHAEHCESHRQADAGELRQAVGGDTVITAPIPSLHLVRSEVGEDESTFRRAANIGRAAVPDQMARRAQMATARHPRSDA